MYEVSIVTQFSAAHHLPGYPGACASPHGHNWEVEVFVRGPKLDRTGILADFVARIPGLFRQGKIFFGHRKCRQDLLPA